MLKSVFLEVTRKCNLHCLFCSNDSEISLREELSLDEMVILLGKFNQMGVSDLRLYGGEPFLFPNIFSLIGAARAFDMSVSIYTNGTIMNDEILGGLVQHKVRKIFVSIDSSNADEHDAIRDKPGSHKTVIENVGALLSIGMNVDVLFTICKINAKSIGSTYAFLARLGINDVKANFVTCLGRAQQNWPSLRLRPSELRKGMREIFNEHLKFFGRIPLRKKCQAASAELFVTSNGDVYPCALFIEPEYLAGNVRHDTLQRIWNNPQGILSNIRRIIEQSECCGDCRKKEVCHGGCRARAAAASNGDLLAPDQGSCIFHKEILQ